MSIKNEPHYTVSSASLADWLDRQGDDCWWSVGGDRLLTGLISFPCVSSELARVLRRIKQPLLVLALNGPPTARGERLESGDFEKLCDRDRVSNRRFVMAWSDALIDASGDDIEWVLREDLETAAYELALSSGQSELEN